MPTNTEVRVARASAILPAAGAYDTLLSSSLFSVDNFQWITFFFKYTPHTLAVNPACSYKIVHAPIKDVTSLYQLSSRQEPAIVGGTPSVAKIQEVEDRYVSPATPPADFFIKVPRLSVESKFMGIAFKESGDAAHPGTVYCEFELLGNF